MKHLTVVIALLGLIAIANAGDHASLGYREDTVIESEQSDECSGALSYNHDYSFENAYCWQYYGVGPPCYGAWGEAFDVGPANTECSLFWLTSAGWEPHAIVDVYVWQGGVTGPPAMVLTILPGFYLGVVDLWPTCTLLDAEIDCCVNGEFTVGFWVDFSDQSCDWYCCSDENGPGGHPWTNIAPGIGYPSGWQHPNVVWPNCRSLGIGATIIETPSPAESRTWGSIKALFE